MGSGSEDDTGANAVVSGGDDESLAGTRYSLAPSGVDRSKVGVSTSVKAIERRVSFSPNK